MVKLLIAVIIVLIFVSVIVVIRCHLLHSKFFNRYWFRFILIILIVQLMF